MPTPNAIPAALRGFCSIFWMTSSAPLLASLQAFSPLRSRALHRVFAGVAGRRLQQLAQFREVGAQLLEFGNQRVGIFAGLSRHRFGPDKRGSHDRGAGRARSSAYVLDVLAAKKWLILG
jgi:hypothetical protein